MRHKFKTCDCFETGCLICDGELVCEVCGLSEGCLTTDCPGVGSFSRWADYIYNGEMDYVDWGWVSQASPFSPKGMKQGVKA